MAKLCLHHGFYMHGASVLKQKIAQLHQPKTKANQKHNAKNAKSQSVGVGGGPWRRCCSQQYVARPFAERTMRRS